MLFLFPSHDPIGTQSRSEHEDMHQNPNILFWEIHDATTPQQAAAADLNVLRETGGNKNNIAYRMTSGNPYRTYKLSGKTPIRSLVDDPENANQSTTFNTNPTDERYLLVGAMSKDGGSCSDYRFDIRLVYYIEMTDPLVVEEEN